MAFIVENGTGLEDANSYVDVAYADAYLGAGWAADEAAKQAALIKATEYIDIRWGGQLLGKPLKETQSLEMPREGLFNRYGIRVEGIPIQWKKAVCVYAQNADSLYPQPTGTAKEVKRERVSVGPVSKEVEYIGQNSATGYISFPLADQFATQFTTGSSGSVIR